MGLGFIVTLVGCGTWYLAESFAEDGGRIYGKLFMFSAIMFGLGVGSSARAAINGFAQRRYLVGAISALEVACYSTLLVLFLVSLHDHLKAAWGGSILFMIIAVTATGLIALFLLLPTLEALARSSKSD
jgi:hypothetical protein